VDVRTELASPDYDLVRMLVKSGKPVFLAVNKAEGDAMAAAAQNFRQLGIREVYPVSSEHGLGIGELLDAVSKAIPVTESPAEGEVELAEQREVSEGGPLEPGAEDEPHRQLHR